MALCVIVTLEHLEWSRPPGSFQLPTLAGGYGPGPFLDVTAWSHREYGHRVGIFRVLDVPARHGVTPTIAMDVLTAEHYPFLRTPGLLAEAGIRYVCDGVNDEQPYPLRVPRGNCTPCPSPCRWTTSTPSGTGGSTSTSAAR